MFEVICKSCGLRAGYAEHYVDASQRIMPSHTCGEEAPELDYDRILDEIISGRQ